MISMSSQSRPNQKKRDFEKDIVFLVVFWTKKRERERERERDLWERRRSIDSKKKHESKKRKKTLAPQKI